MTQALNTTEMTQALNMTEITQALSMTKITQALDETEMTQALNMTEMFEMTQALGMTEMTQALNMTEMTQALNMTEMTQALGMTEMTQTLNMTEMTQALNMTEMTQALNMTEMTQALNMTEMTQICLFYSPTHYLGGMLAGQQFLEPAKDKIADGTPTCLWHMCVKHAFPRWRVHMKGKNERVKIPPRKTRHVRFGGDDMDKVIDLEGGETDDWRICPCVFLRDLSPIYETREHRTMIVNWFAEVWTEVPGITGFSQSGQEHQDYC
ncbi:hypothetical protein Bbelb_211880 [Branchiostoma belcheri]|nr:hypothetical protein Bbelb_211880 [Branchiostoma belcheri]